MGDDDLMDPPPSPADWLRANEASLRGDEAAVRVHAVSREGVKRIHGRPRGSRTGGKPSLAGGLLHVASSDKWLYSNPPSYCNVSVNIKELVTDLEKRIYYLGPVTRHKVVRAIELAQGAVGVKERELLSNITVALIVADLQMDCETVCAAVLRGVVGRPGCIRADVERHVGGDVLRVLKFHEQVVRSVNLCGDSSFTELSFSNLRELILVGAEEEHRAISLELARAVLAIRTVDALEHEEDRIAVARRTMYLYGPLANQLGIWFVQSELEELAFMHLQPESFHMIRHLVGERRRECESTLAESKEFLERVLATTPEVRSVVRTVLIKGRVKGLYSVYRKMRRSGKNVFEIYDLLALRVVVQPKRADEASEEAACYAVADVIKRHYETFESRAKDYISSPKRNGYRSLHMTVLPVGGSTPLEIQVRTEKMNHVAEFGAAAHWIYKERSVGDDNDGDDPPSAGTPSVGDVSLEDRDAADEESEREQCLKIDQGVSVLYKPRSKKRLYARPNVMTNRRAIVSKTVATKNSVKYSSSASNALLSAMSRVGSRRFGTEEMHDQLRQGYVTCLASAIRTSRVIVATAGQLYGLAIGSTLLDLSHALGVASLGAIAVVNGSVAPLTQRLEMNDIVRFISALPEA